MKVQDEYYLTNEGNDFFTRNFLGKELPPLRENKETIIEFIDDSNIKFDSIIEFGCNYGDLLDYYSHKVKGRLAGIEASDKAIEFGKNKFSNRVEMVHGVIGDNSISNDSNNDGQFDLAIVDDVFSWVSRNTILKSIANVDKSIKEGGFLFIRDFSPHKFTKNVNHHVESADIFNFKVVGSHSKILIQTGMYEIVSEKIYYDKSMSGNYLCDNPFNYRWSDVVLQKKSTDFFDEVTKL